MKPYVYREHGVDMKLTIKSCGDGQSGAHVEVDGEYVDVSASDVPAAALALYEAAGLPEPLILPRPELVPGTPLAIGTPERNVHVAGRAVWLQDGHVHVEDLRRDPRLGLDGARLLAAAIAVHADALTEPDPAEVERLAGLIEAEDYDLDYESRHALARSILLGGWKREPKR